MSTTVGPMCAVGYSRSPWDAFQPSKSLIDLKKTHQKRCPPRKHSHNIFSPQSFPSKRPPWACNRSFQSPAKHFLNASEGNSRSKGCTCAR